MALVRALPQLEAGTSWIWFSIENLVARTLTKTNPPRVNAAPDHDCSRRNAAATAVTVNAGFEQWATFRGTDTVSDWSGRDRARAGGPALVLLKANLSMMRQRDSTRSHMSVAQLVGP
jgi:hypothetical protein